MGDLVTLLHDAYECYSTFAAAHPHYNAMLTGEVTYMLGDGISQLIKDRRLDPKKLVYTAKLAPLLGLGVEALIDSGEWVGRHLSDRAFDMAALGPNLWGNIFNAWFFTNNTVGEKTGYRWYEPFRHYWESVKAVDPLHGPGLFWESVKRSVRDHYVKNIPRFDYEKSVLGTAVAWNVFQTLNYSYVPPMLRTSVSLTASLVWTVLLSLWSLGGRRTVTGEQAVSASILNAPLPELRGRAAASARAFGKRVRAFGERLRRPAA